MLQNEFTYNMKLLLNTNLHELENSKLQHIYSIFISVFDNLHSEAIKATEHITSADNPDLTT